MNAVAEPIALSIPSDSPAAIAIAAKQAGCTQEEVREMLAAQKDWRADQSRMAFDKAMTAFKAEAVQIVKSRTVEADAATGSRQRMYAELADVIDAITPALTKQGFSWRWDTKQSEGWIDVTCILKHEGGHFETCTLGGPPDDTSGKNAAQAIASTKTFFERYTLKAICGIAEKGQDDDGRGAKAITSAKTAAADAALEAGRAAAAKGMAALTHWWGKLSAKERTRLNKQFAALKKSAAANDGGAK